MKFVDLLDELDKETKDLYAVVRLGKHSVGKPEYGKRWRIDPFQVDTIKRFLKLRNHDGDNFITIETNPVELVLAEGQELGDDDYAVSPYITFDIEFGTLYITVVEYEEVGDGDSYEVRSNKKFKKEIPISSINFGGYNPLEFKDITDDYLKREIKRSYAVLKLENSSKSDEDLYRTVFWGLTEKYGRSSTSRINALINDICGLRI